jgi:hypothetical protein
MVMHSEPAVHPAAGKKRAAGGGKGGLVSNEAAARGLGGKGDNAGEWRRQGRRRARRGWRWKDVIDRSRPRFRRVLVPMELDLEVGDASWLIAEDERDARDSGEQHPHHFHRDAVRVAVGHHLVVAQVIIAAHPQDHGATILE